MINPMSKSHFLGVRPVTMEGQIFLIPEDPSQTVVAHGSSFVELLFETFQNSGKKTISPGDLGHLLLEKFSSRSWKRCGVISCSPYSSFDQINYSVVKSKCAELVRGSESLLVYSAHSTASDLWRAPIRLLLKTHLAAGV